MDFSIVLPSRGVKQDVFKMLDSFERTTHNKKQIEFLIAIDKGNKEIVQAVRDREYSFWIQFYEREKTEDFTNDYYNWLADRVLGENIMAFNDDAWMRTDKWDVKLKKHLSKYPWTVYMVDIPDTARIKYRNWFPCFPMVSRRAVCTLGYLLFKGVKMYPADKITHTIYSQANRIIRVNDILIEHEHIIESDPSKKEMMDIFLKDTGNGRKVDIGEDILRLLKVCATDFNVRKSKFQQVVEIIKGE